MNEHGRPDKLVSLLPPPGRRGGSRAVNEPRADILRRFDIILSNLISVPGLLPLVRTIDKYLTVNEASLGPVAGNVVVADGYLQKTMGFDIKHKFFERILFLNGGYFVKFDLIRQVESVLIACVQIAVNGFNVSYFNDRFVQLVFPNITFRIRQGHFFSAPPAMASVSAFEAPSVSTVAVSSSNLQESDVTLLEVLVARARR
jgi:hypothetical protein